MADDTRVTKSRCALACAVVLFWALGCTLPAVSNAAELLVQRDAGLSAHERADLRADAGVTFERTSALPRTELVSVPDSDEQAALIKLNADPHVAYAAPNITFHTAGLAVPPLTNDPGAYLQWDFESPTTDADIDLSSAWRLNDRRPGAGVDVAVVDQLVHQTHEDFAGQIDTEDARNFVQHTDCPAD